MAICEHQRIGGSLIHQVDALVQASDTQTESFPQLNLKPV